MATTRCGTNRIGTRVATVSSPVRKFARVGRAREHAGEHRAHVRQRQARLPGGCGELAEDPRPAWVRCHASGSATSVSRSSACPSCADQTGAGFGPRSRGQRRVEPVQVFGESARKVDVAAVHVIERQCRAQPCQLGLVGGDTEQQPVAGGAERVLPNARSARTAVAAPRHSPHRAPPSAVQRPQRLQVRAR